MEENWDRLEAVATSELSDLHRHLDGSIRRTTLSELARLKGVSVPEDLCFFPGMGLQAALARFQFTLSVLTDPLAVRRVAAEMCEDALAEGVTTLEIRFAPQLHGDFAEEFVDAALEGIAGRAGLILCGLYGENPSVLHHLVTIGAQRRGVVGIDLAGGPAPAHRWRLEDYQSPFEAAKRAGLGRTVHASEGRPAKEIAAAIEVLDAQRVGHGTTLMEDPEVLALVVERQVVIEACPTSNVHTGVIEGLAEHPIRGWMERGVQVCLCTDNTLLSNVDAPGELRAVAEACELTVEQVEQLVHTGHVSAFSSVVPD